MRFFSRVCVVVVLAMTTAPLLAEPATGLRDYVDKKDDSFKFEVKSNHDLGQTKILSVRLTSQKWRDTEWQHWLTIIVPGKIQYPDKAILFITGGSSRDSAPSLDSKAAKMFIPLAERTNAVFAVLQQVPNQPLYEGKYEDALIAHTFAKYIETGDNEWPLLLPMTKSAVKAMDAVQAIVKERINKDITGFVVTGASKRGWTTWLTAATQDKRVIAIAPMVIDVLNFDPQMKHQRESYGKLSEQIGDYDKLNLPDKLKTENGKKLNDLVDPYSYRKDIKIPKLILLGTNDPYWTVDASSIYFNNLVGSRHLYYEPNAGHGLGAGIYPTLLAFFHASMAGKTLPRLTWEKKADGTISASWDDKFATATLWEAKSDTRDFRKAKWTPSPLEADGKVDAKVAEPKQGWSAFYVEVKFPSAGIGPFSVCTEMSVLPKALPFKDAK